MLKRTSLFGRCVTTGLKASDFAECWLPLRTCYDSPRRGASQGHSSTPDWRTHPHRAVRRICPVRV